MACICSRTNAISIRQGQTLNLPFTQRRLDGTAVDITGEKFRFLIKVGDTITAIRSDTPRVDPVGSNPYDPADPPTQSVIGVVDGPEGKWRLKLSAVFTASIPAGTHEYEIEKIQSDGSVDPILSGEFKIAAELGS